MRKLINKYFLVLILLSCTLLYLPAQEGEEKQEPSGEKVAFLPFEHSYGISEEYAANASNEIVYYMLESKKFQPVSLKEWADEKFKDQAGKSVPNLLERARYFKIGADYICHGHVFRSGKSYGLKVALYPLDKSKAPSYYYRSFNNYRNLKYIAVQIVDEMIKRAQSPNPPIMDKKIFIRNFYIDYSLYSTSSSGKTTVSKLPFFLYKGVELRREDHFFHELLLYNFHTFRIFEVWNNNMSIYTNPDLIVPKGHNFDYFIDGEINISKERSFLSLIVQDGKSKKVLFTNKYFLESLDLDYLSDMMRSCTRDITYRLLNEDDEELIGKVNLEGYYGDEALFCDDFYIGKGNQSGLLLPVGMTKVRTWFGEELLAEKIIQKELSGAELFNSQWERTVYLNIGPQSEVKPKEPPLKLSIGGLIYTGFYFHPKYDDKSQVVFRESGRHIYTLGEIISDKDVPGPFNFQPNYQVGVGLDFSLNHSRFLLFNQLGFKFNHFQSKIKVKLAENDVVEIRDRDLKNLDLDYELLKYNFTFEYSVLPAVQFMKKDSPIKLYTGVGLFVNLLYSRYSETITGRGTIDLDNYTLNVLHEDRHHLFLNTGLFPELGVIINYSRFNIKVALAYNLDLFKYNIMTNSYYGLLDSFNTSTFQLKVGFGYYLN